MIGRALSHYEIVGELGRGGMGEVYRARDTKLKRDVAIKVLPEEFSRDKERLARFEREAQLLASLNHPNIASIYGIEEANGVKALVLELVEGPTLAERIAEGAIPVDEALALARQMLDALEAAHGDGIIHRDLKPANVKVTEDGQVKVLDFGLAKALQSDGRETGESELSQSPTLTREGTAHGVILGTAAYMSPEQAKGKRVDRQTDVWAFGAVLYEMLTGRKAFLGEDVSDTLAAVLRAEPDWSALPSSASPTIPQVLRLCLAKDKRARIQAVGDVRLALDSAFVAASPVEHRGLPRAAMAFALVLGGVILGVLTPRPGELDRESGSAVRFTVPLPRSVGPLQPEMAISPTTDTLALRLGRDLYLRPIGALDARRLTNEGDSTSPAFSPDGEWVAYAAPNHIKKVRVRGDDAPIALCSVSGTVSGLSWGDDESVVFALDPTGIFRVSSDGGEPEVVLSVEGEVAEFPRLLPGSDALLFVSRASRAAPWDEARIVALSLETGERRVVVEGRSAMYVSTGHLVYHRGASLFAAPFDLERLELTGTPVPVVDQVRGHAWPFANWTAFDLSPSGGLVYLPVDPQENRLLVRVSRDGDERPVALPPKPYGWFQVSPDGSRLALDVGEGPGGDIWIHDFASSVTSQFTFDPAPDRSPLWTPDGERVIFWSDRDGGAFFWKRADGIGSEERLTPPTVKSAYGHSVTPDGRFLLFNTGDSDAFDIYAVTLDDEHLVEPIVASPYDERRPNISPDGRFLAYMSDETGSLNIMVRSFPDLEGKWRVSPNGGISPLWSRDGRELFYWEGPSFMRVSVDPRATFRFSTPQRIFEGPYRSGARTFDEAPNGDGFLMSRDETTELLQARVVLNWLSELEARVPTERR